MTIGVWLPTPLRKYSDEQETVEIGGETVGEVLENLTQKHPDLRRRLFSDDGSVRRFINIFANDEDIRFQDNLETKLTEGAELRIIPAIAGG
jgi:sulfur-carrier protein